MNRSRTLTYFTFALALCIALTFFFLIPTIDYDESLYRSVAENMKAAHDPFHLAWDGRPLFHKPPVFYWIVWGFSLLVDGVSYGVSTLAARLPSFFSSIGILIYLWKSGDRISGRPAGKHAALAFLCGFFPLITATSAIFDPLQTLCLMPALVVPALLFAHPMRVCRSDWVLWSLSLFAACATKGLNGIIVPTFAFGLHCLLLWKRDGFGPFARLVARFTATVFLPACLMTAIFYAWLDQKIGPAFTHEFIWVQHFERGTAPMEEHSGSFLYHFFVLFFGGGVLIPLLALRIRNLKSTYFFYAFPLTFALSFLIVFGLSATKLPHYSWPAWPALALFVGVASTTLPASTARKSPIAFALSFSSVALIGIAALLLAVATHPMLAAISGSAHTATILSYFPTPNLFEITSLLVTFASCVLVIWKRKEILRSFEWAALMSTLIALSLSLGVARGVRELLVTPFYDAAATLKKEGANSADCIWYSGSLSATLSLALAPEVVRHHCEPFEMRFFIAPEWKEHECTEEHLNVIQHANYLIVCKKG